MTKKHIMKNIQNHLLEDVSCLKSEICKLYTQVLTIVYINITWLSNGHRFYRAVKAI